MILKNAVHIKFLLLLLAFATPVPAETEVLPAQTVEILEKVHFLAADGADAVIPAGFYNLASSEGTLQLVPAEGGAAFLLQAHTAATEEKVSEPVARSVPIHADGLYLALLLPNGQLIEALGSYSGVRPRGNWREYLEEARKRLEDAAGPEETAVLEMEPDCINRPPKKINSQARQCSNPEGKNNIGSCTVWDPPKSDRCAAMTNRGLPVNFDYFGQSDCRTNARPRKNAVTMIVLHNGDHARGNTRTWMCRKASSHYTINRDGKVYQHVGEERVAWHAGRVNRKSIGIELQIRRGYGSSCNSLIGKKLEQVARKNGLRSRDIIRELCGPTAAQYDALRTLIADIKTRHPIAEGGIVGHCEVVKPNGHGDPRAFDWRRIGISNESKRGYVETHETACNWYNLY